MYELSTNACINNFQTNLNIFLDSRIIMNFQFYWYEITKLIFIKTLKTDVLFYWIVSFQQLLENV